jgi:hypothetical protein
MSPTWRFLFYRRFSRGVVCVMAGAFGEIMHGTCDLHRD